MRQSLLEEGSVFCSFVFIRQEFHRVLRHVAAVPLHIFGPLHSAGAATTADRAPRTVAEGETRPDKLSGA